MKLRVDVPDNVDPHLGDSPLCAGRVAVAERGCDLRDDALSLLRSSPEFFNAGTSAQHLADSACYNVDEQSVIFIATLLVPGPATGSARAITSSRTSSSAEDFAATRIAANCRRRASPRGYLADQGPDSSMRVAG